MVGKNRFIFFGTTNELSRNAFSSLIASGAEGLAVVVTAKTAGYQGNIRLEELRPPASATELPLVNRYHDPSLIHEAWSADVPVMALGTLGYALLQELMNDVRPDVACVACFPRRIPPNLITQPPLGFLNLHPSLLPSHRGPAPLFWLFQQDDTEHRGVTVHLIDKEMDTGPIVRQEPIMFASGQHQAAIERQCGRVGGRLLREAIEQLSRGFPARPQSGASSYYPWPEADDFTLDTRLPALRAFNFMRATDGFGMSFRVLLPSKELFLTEAQSVDPAGVLDSAISIDGTTVQLQFNPGILTATVSPL